MYFPWHHMNGMSTPKNFLTLFLFFLLKLMKQSANTSEIKIFPKNTNIL